MSQQNVTDYPIIARTKYATSVKNMLMDFFSVMIKSIDAADILFTNVELIENVQVWLSTMSAAQNRPFRHTATVASLSVISALCDIGKDLASAAATAKRQSENMRKGKGANKKRASGLDKDAQDAQKKQTLVETSIKDWFDTIYIHRYRDVDAKIRVDCAEALGSWISSYPDVFFDAQHLRYLGWVLSDTSWLARHEVVKQLLRLYEKKDRLAGLKVFTERFRERIVEMATLDSETSVRASAIALLSILRDAGYLEPDDIDVIGKLVFDAEPRVRKAVVPFFLSSVSDNYDAKVEDMGGVETITEELGDVADSSERPGLPWLKIKCLAEILEAYDAIEPESSRHAVKGPGNNYRLHAEEVESRFIIVAQSLYPDSEMLHDWDALAKFLLYDTSEGARNGAAGGIAAQLKAACKLSSREEYILLEMLNVSIRQHVAELVDASIERRGKKTKRQRDELADEQESSARQITTLIPQLLRRFGDSPETALAVLQLERIVSLDAFSDFQQDPSSYKALLDDIEKQFMSHGNQEVMTEASRALLRARNYQDLGEVTDEKIEELWEETIETFRRLCGNKDPSVRHSLSANVLDGLTKTVYRMEQLSRISDPTSHLRTVPEARSGRKQTKASATSQSSILDLLAAMVRRAILEPDVHEGRTTAEAEDAVSIHAAQILGLDLFWSIASLRTAPPTSATDSRVSSLVEARSTMLSGLVSVIESRSPSSAAAFVSSQILADAYTSSATLRQFSSSHPDLPLDMPSSAQTSLLRVLTALERRLASKTGKHIERPREPKKRKPQAAAAAPKINPDTDEALAASPVASDDESAAGGGGSDPPSAPPSLVTDSSSSSGSDSDTSRQATRRLAASLRAEQRLCALGGKLVLLALAGASADEKALRKRLELNRGRLGANWREVIRFLDPERPKGRTQVRRKVVEKVVVEESSSDDEVEEGEDEEVDGEGEREEAEEEEEVEAEIESVIGD